MTEHPQNVRSSRIIERGHPSTGHNSRQPMPAARNEDNQTADRFGNGGHRTHEHTAAQQRNSRVGRHYVDHRDDTGNRW